MTTRLEARKSQAAKKPPVLFGARQTGKTTSVVGFTRSSYGQVVRIDFYKQPHLKAAFRGSLESAVVVSALSALLNRDIASTGTLLFFDEVKDCDEAITSIIGVLAFVAASPKTMRCSSWSWRVSDRTIGECRAHTKSNSS